MILTLTILIASSLLGIYIYNNRRIPASGGDWLMVKSKQQDGSFFMLSFYPIIGWKLQRGVFMPEIQSAKQLKKFEGANQDLGSIFYVRGGRVFNPYADNHPVGSLVWFVNWVCKEDEDRIKSCWANEIPDSFSKK